MSAFSVMARRLLLKYVAVLFTTLVLPGSPFSVTESSGEVCTAEASAPLSLQTESGQGDTSNVEVVTGNNLFQMHTSPLTRRINLLADDRHCSPLTNKGTFFTVGVTVGTPPQSFSLVADTGSDAVIVASCECEESGLCGTGFDRCFRGTNQSSTFRIQLTQTGKLPGASITFGSGKVDTLVTTDVVRVGSTEALMENGVLLMVDRSSLRIEGQFEGILGLGIPRKTTVEAAELSKHRKHRKHRHSSGAVRSPGVHSYDIEDDDIEEDDMQDEDLLGRRPTKHPLALKLFAETANVSRFSICFGTDGTSPGALRMSVPAFDRPLGTVGTVHWALGINGIYVGGDDVPSGAPPVLCGGATNSSQANGAPCVGIPDTGTTLMLGPRKQITALMTSICDNWPRCNATLPGMARHKVFQRLLAHCGSWLSEGEGLAELPPVRLNMSGSAAGEHQEISLTAYTYVLEVIDESVLGDVLFDVTADELDIPFTGNGSLTELQGVCHFAFGGLNFPTELHGPVWIMGTPLFYEYSVGFDLEGMALSFEPLADGGCQSCGRKASFLSDSEEIEQAGASHGRPPRQLRGPLRRPSWEDMQVL